jgi:hypothetical protein
MHGDYRFHTRENRGFSIVKSTQKSVPQHLLFFPAVYLARVLTYVLLFHLAEYFGMQFWKVWVLLEWPCMSFMIPCFWSSPSALSTSKRFTVYLPLCLYSHTHTFLALFACTRDSKLTAPFLNLPDSKYTSSKHFSPRLGDGIKYSWRSLLGG